MWAVGEVFPCIKPSQGILPSTPQCLQQRLGRNGAAIILPRVATGVEYQLDPLHHSDQIAQQPPRHPRGMRCKMIHQALVQRCLLPRSLARPDQTPKHHWLGGLPTPEGVGHGLRGVRPDCRTHTHTYQRTTMEWRARCTHVQVASATLTYITRMVAPGKGWGQPVSGHWDGPCKPSHHGLGGERPSRQPDAQPIPEHGRCRPGSCYPRVTSQATANGVGCPPNWQQTPSPFSSSAMVASSSAHTDSGT